MSRSFITINDVYDGNKFSERQACSSDQHSAIDIPMPPTADHDWRITINDGNSEQACSSIMPIGYI